jgi:hypothetical protein
VRSTTNRIRVFNGADKSAEIVCNSTNDFVLRRSNIDFLTYDGTTVSHSGINNYFAGNVGIGTLPVTGEVLKLNGSTKFQINGIDALKIGENRNIVIGDGAVRAVGSDNPGFTDLLHIEGHAGSSVHYVLTSAVNRPDVFGPVIAIGKSRGTVSNSNVIVEDFDYIGDILFCGADGVDMSNQGASIVARVDGTPAENIIPARLIFRTTNSSGVLNDGLTITSAGDVIINTGNLQPGTDNSKSCGTAGVRWTFVYAANGTIQTSDATFKNVVNTIDGPCALSLINKLEPVNYEWKDNAEPGKNQHMGFLAQQVDQVVGENSALVSRPQKEGEPYGLQYSELLAPLVGAVQELDSENTKLKEEVKELFQALIAENAALKAQVNTVLVRLTAAGL